MYLKLCRCQIRERKRCDHCSQHRVLVNNSRTVSMERWGQKVSAMGMKFSTTEKSLRTFHQGTEQSNRKVAATG